MIVRSGEWIREWRDKNNYTQENLAGELGVKRQTIMQWEKSSDISRIVFLAITALNDHAIRNIGLKDRNKSV